jgi:hypothetical protein
MNNIEKLDTKEKILIIKAISEITTNAYNSNKQFILNQVMKKENKQIRNDYGLFSKRTNKAKTVQDLINSKYAQIAKLQDEIATLGTYKDKTQIVQEENTTLVSSYTALAEDTAKTIVIDLIKDLQSKRLEKSI